jgi:hypothetical protein
MSIGKEITKVTQKGIAESIRTTNILRNLSFDKNHFSTSFHGGGYYVSAKFPERTGEDFEHHFQVDSNTASDVVVHAGRWIRYVSEWDEEAGEFVEVPHIVKMTTDDGTSGKYEDVKTLDFTSLSNNNNYSIILELDDRESPTSLTASIHGQDYPDSDDLTFEQKVIAKVNKDEDNVLTVEQYWTGGDIADIWRKMEIEPDEISLNKNPGGKYQWYNWHISNTSPLRMINGGWNLDDCDVGLTKLCGTDVIGVQPRGDPANTLKYASLAELQDYFKSYFESEDIWALKEHYHYWKDLLDTDGDPSLSGNFGLIPIVKEVSPGNYKLQLSHAGDLGSFWELGTTNVAKAFGAVIGNQTQQLTIHLNNRQLLNGNWSCSNNFSVGSDLFVGNDAEIGVDLDVKRHTTVGGTLTVDLGIYTGEGFFIDDGATNAWREDLMEVAGNTASFALTQSFSVDSLDSVSIRGRQDFVLRQDDGEYDFWNANSYSTLSVIEISTNSAGTVKTYEVLGRQTA